MTSYPARRKEASALGSRSMLAVTAVLTSALATEMRIHLWLFMLIQSCKHVFGNNGINPMNNCKCVPEDLSFLTYAQNDILLNLF